MLVKCLLIGLVATVLGTQDQPTDAPSRAAKAQPKLVLVGKKTLDLGKIREGEKIDAVYVLENQGHADLIIERVKASCGCTTVKLTQEEKVIPPGRRQQIVARFDSTGRPGAQSKGLTVYSNDRQNSRLKLTFKVEVETLFRTMPHAKYVFRNIRRGERLPKHIDVVPTQAKGELEVVSVEIPGTTLHHTVEPLPGEESRGKRITLTADQDAPLGGMRSVAKITVRVGEETETRDLKILGVIVGELTIKPAVTRTEQPTIRGNQLRPVVIASSTGQPFEVFSTSAGPNFVTTVEPEADRTRYTIKVRIADDAPDGPCGSFLEVRTDSLMQPLIRVPVFALVAPRINVEPPLVLLRWDGSPEATGRRIALQHSSGSEFSILQTSVDQDFLEVAPVERASRPSGARFLRVNLKDKLASGDRRATVTVRTDVPGAEVLEIPVVVTGPKSAARVDAGR